MRTRSTTSPSSAVSSGAETDDLFKVTQVVKGSEAAATVEETGCKLTWPA